MTLLTPTQRGRAAVARADSVDPYAPEADPRIGRYVLSGLMVLALFIGGALYWAIVSKLDGAVVAPASFVVEGNRKMVEHLDGGIVQEILVKDGEFVEAGQPLLALDSTDIDVDLDVLGSQIGEFSMRGARLRTQIAWGGAFTAADAAASLPAALAPQHWQRAYETQHQLFETERRARDAEAQILTARVSSLSDQIEGLEEQRRANNRQLAIARQELSNLTSLQDKGIVAAPQVNDRRIDIERLIGIDAALRTEQAQARNQIGELELADLGQRKLRDEALATELATVEAQLAALTPQYLGATARRKRVEVTAPSAGRVVNLAVFTAGEVLSPGEPILDIVPADEELVLEARVQTSDIDKLRIGQPSRVRLSAFAQSDVPEATGRIVDISADALEDPRSGEPYYLARVKLDPEQSADVEALELVPGMPADLFVQTGERAAIAYLAQPISDRLARTFIE